MELARVFEKIDHFLDFFFGLVATGYVGKGDSVGALVKHAGFAFAKAERTALATALHLAHEVNPDTNQQQHGPPAEQQADQEGAFLAGLDVEFDVVINQVAHQAAIQIGGSGTHAPIIGGESHNFGTAGAFLDGGAFDAVVVYFVQEVGITDIARAHGAASIKLLENSKQHHGHNEPDGNFRKPLIVQAGLQ